MKNRRFFISLGQGPFIIQVSFFIGLAVMVIVYFFIGRFNGAIWYGVTGLLTVALSIFYHYKKREINTFYGFPTWGWGLVFLFFAISRIFTTD